MTMDRTGDFVKIALLFDSGTPRAAPQHRPLSIDARRAQQIADALRQQELGLRELQALVARKSILGDDPGARIAALTDALKRELGAAESGITRFQEAVATPRGRAQPHHQAHFAVVCSSLKSRCAKSVKLFHVRFFPFLCLTAGVTHADRLARVYVCVGIGAASTPAAHSSD